MSIFAIIGAIAVGLMFGDLVRRAERTYRRKAAAHKRASFDRHTNQAIALTDTPTFERLAAEMAAGLDGEWRRFDEGGGVAS